MLFGAFYINLLLFLSVFDHPKLVLHYLILSMFYSFFIAQIFWSWLNFFFSRSSGRKWRLLRRLLFSDFTVIADDVTTGATMIYPIFFVDALFAVVTKAAISGLLTIKLMPLVTSGYLLA